MDENSKELLLENMAKNLPALRAKAGLTQAKLAEMIGVSRQTLGTIETSKRKMTWNTFLSCYLVFHKNPETDLMLRMFEIRTDELDDYLQGNSSSDEV